MLLKKTIQYAFFILFFSFFSTISAQNTVKIEGKIVDELQKPIGNMVVALLHPTDSTIVKSTVTDTLGSFVFEVLAKNYLLKANLMTYETAFQNINLNDFSKENTLKLPTIALKPSAELATVTITGSQLFITRKVDRLVVRPELLIANAGGTALDVLANTPSVSVDVNDNISLRGKSNVVVLIDDKPSYLPPSELANFLRGIGASNIDVIEIMTNPPARYSAEGTGGVINIKLKKTTVKGTNGSLSLSYGQGVYRRTNNSLNINHRVNKINFFANLGINSNYSFQDLVIERNYLNTDQSPKFDFRQNSYIKHERNANNLRIGADIYATKRATFSVVANGFLNPALNRTSNVATVKNPSGRLDSVVNALNVEDRTWQNRSLGANYTLKIDTAGKKELSISADYIVYESKSGLNLTNEVLSSSSSMQNNDKLVGDFPGNIDIKTVQTDYNQPVLGGAFSVGGKLSFIETDNIANFFDDRNGVQTPNYQLTNRFQYTENINAAYVNYSKEGKKWGFQAGLRMENTNITGYQFGNPTQRDSSFKRNYTDYFPTVYLSYNLDSAGNHALNTSYGYRINRPDYQSLNPFTYPLDKFTLYAGNPFLKPVYTHTLELGYTYKGFWTTTLFSNYSIDNISETIENSSIFISRPGNAGNIRATGINTNINKNLAKWCVLQLYLVTNYIQAKGNLYGQNFDTKSWAYEGNSTLQFKLNNLWTTEVSGNFRSRVVAGQFATYPTQMVNFGVQRKILKEKGLLKFALRDAFYIFRPGGDLSALANSRARYYSSLDTRVGVLSFTYRFNKGQSLRARTNTAADEEKSRVKS